MKKALNYVREAKSWYGKRKGIFNWILLGFLLGVYMVLISYVYYAEDAVFRIGFLIGFAFFYVCYLLAVWIVRTAIAIFLYRKHLKTAATVPPADCGGPLPLEDM